jgi:phage terminase small subunit
MRQVTDQQKAFAIAYVRSGGKGLQSAIDAGYSEKTARVQASQLLDLAHVQAAIAEAQRKYLTSNLATKAIQVLEAAMGCEDAPWSTRVDAAKAVLDRAGHPARRGTEIKEDAHRDMSELSIPELEALLRRLENERAANAKPILDGTAVEIHAP